MTQDIIANFFTFSDANGTVKINYYPHARLEYQGPEGHFLYPGTSPGRETITTQEQSLPKIFMLACYLTKLWST